MKFFKFTAIFLLLAISTITFAHEHNGTTYDECDDCPYWKMHYFSEADAKLLWYTTKDEPSSSITLTYGPCEGDGGDRASGVLMVGFNPDSAFCNDPNYHPCHSQHVYGVAKISGNNKAFQAFFPGGIRLKNSGWCSFHLDSTEEKRFEIGFPHRLQMTGGGSVENGAEQAGTEEATFKLEIKFYEETTDDEDNLLSTQELGNCSATINVAPNKSTGFDPTNLTASASSNEGFASIEKIERDFANDEEWSYSYTATDWVPYDCEPCSSVDVQAGPSNHYDGTSMLSSTATLYKVKIPGFEKPVIATPDYVSASGWSVNISGGYILFNMPGVGDIKFHTGTDVSAASAGTYPCTYVEYPTNEPNDTGIRWRMSYNPDGTMNKMYRPSESDPNSIDTCYYDYSWDENGCMVIDYYNTDIDASNPIRTWSKCYDENGNLVESGNGGCSSCGGGSDYVKYEYYDPNDNPELEGLIKKKFNSDGDVILWNEYRAFDPNDGFYIVSPLIEEQYAVKAPDTAYEETVKFKSYTYDLTELSAIEKTWVDNSNYRVKKLYYSDNSFSDVEKQIEFATLNDNPANPTGDYYITEYELEDVNDISIYVDGIKVHHRNFTRKYTSTNQATPYRVDVSQYNYNFDLIQSYSYIDNDPNTIMGETDYKYSGDYVSEQTDWRGAKTTYSYSGENLLNQKEYLNTTDYLETAYTYYDGYRIETETRKSYTQADGYEVLSYTEYNYDSDDFTLTSIVTYPDNSKQEVLTSNEYKYNDFGEVIREKNGEGIVKGKRYNIAGKLESEFVLANASDFSTLTDTGLSVISQTCYTYDEMGRTEYVKRAVSDSAFTIDSTSVEWITDKYVYDWLGRRTQAIQDYGTSKSNLITETEYNNQGESTRTIAPSNKWTEIIKDGMGRRVQSIIGYGTTDYLTAYYGYDDKGNMDEVIRQDGISYFYGYDNFGRKTSYQTGNLDDTYTTYSYDVWDLTGEFQWNANGTTSETDDVLIKDTRSDYDINGRKIENRILATPGTLSNTEDTITQYTFDVIGNLIEELRYGEPNETYPVYEPVKTEKQYDGLGRLTQVTDADGNIKTYTYNKISAIETETNPSVSYEYDSYGRLEKRIDANSNYTAYSYNSLNQVIKETVYDCNGTPSNTTDDFAVKQTRIQRDNVGRIEYTAIMKNPASTAAIDRSVDMVTDYVYDSTSGLLYQKKNYYNGSSSNVATTTHYYDNIDRNWKTIDAEGNEVRIYYDSTYNYQKVKQEIIQKNTDDATTKTLTVFYEYDSLGRLWKEIEDKDGDGVKETTDLITEYNYDLFGHKAVVTAPDGVVTEFAYDCMGNLDYKIEDPNDGNDNIDRLTDYGYDRLGNQMSISGYDPNTQTTTYSYTKTGKVKKITYPDSTTIEYKYNSLGKVTEKKNKDDSYLYYSYDSVGNLITEADQSGSFNFTDPNCTATFRCEYEYDPLGQIIYFSEEKDDDGFISDTEYAYNGFGLVEEESTFIKDCSEFFTTYTYDQMGNILSRDHEDEEIDYTYDGLGRISSIDRNSDDIITCQYIGAQVRGIDFEENEMTYTASYDELGRITADLYQDNDANTILDFQYDYYDNGNRKSMKYNHLSIPVYDVYDYDNLRRVTQVDSASLSQVLSQASSMSVLLSTDSSSLESVDLQTETVNTKKKSEDPNEISLDTSLESLSEYAYSWLDSQNNTEVLTLSDIPTLMASIVCSNIPATPESGTETFEYTELGNRIIVQHKDGTKTGYQTNHVTNQYENIGPVAYWKFNEESGTDANEEIQGNTGLFYGNTTWSTGIYNNCLLLDGVDDYVVISGYKGVTGTSSRTVSAWVNTSITKGVAIITWGTDYVNGARWMVGINGNSSFQLGAFRIFLHGGTVVGTTNICDGQWHHVVVTLDSDGTPLSDDIVLYIDGYTDTISYFASLSIDSGNQADVHIGDFFRGTDEDFDGKIDDVRIYNRALSADEVSALYNSTREDFLEYDDNGNLTVDETGKSYSYDWRNRLTQAQEGSTTLAEFEYDAIGRRIFKTDGTTDTYYIYDSMGRVVAEYEAPHNTNTTSLARTYVYGNGIDEVLGMYRHNISDPNEETRYYYLTDALGSVRGLVGAVHDREDDREFYNYDVFGKVNETSDVSNPYLFAGMRYDEENNKYHTLHRSYDALRGRWLQPDPLGIEPNPFYGNFFKPVSQYKDGLNIRIRSKNNPVNSNDIWGLWCGVVVKQQDFNPTIGVMGHRWIEFSDSSIGFWPKNPDNADGWTLLLGTDGEVQYPDSHGGDWYDTMWVTKRKQTGKMRAGDKKGTSCKCVTECKDITECIRSFILTTGTWARVGGGYYYDEKNDDFLGECRRFTEMVLEACCLKKTRVK